MTSCRGAVTGEAITVSATTIEPIQMTQAIEKYLMVSAASSTQAPNRLKQESFIDSQPL